MDGDDGNASNASNASEAVATGDENFNNAVASLQDGHVILGENHTSPLARDLLIKLVSSGAVKAIMMEAFQANTLDKKANEDLGFKTRNIFMAMAQDDTAKYKNPTKYQTIVAAANEKDVRVFGCDLPNAKVDDPARDTHMSGMLVQATETYKSGIIMLVGSHHVPQISGITSSSLKSKSFIFS